MKICLEGFLQNEMCTLTVYVDYFSLNPLDISESSETEASLYL